MTPCLTAGGAACGGGAIGGGGGISDGGGAINQVIIHTNQYKLTYLILILVLVTMLLILERSNFHYFLDGKKNLNEHHRFHCRNSNN